METRLSHPLILTLIASGFIFFSFPSDPARLALIWAEDSAPTAEQTDDPASARREEQRRRNVAVALNYCRASFHRIGKYPSPQVMHEEQQKILNNLNLNGIEDEQIIRLYGEVLDEIGQLRLTEHESELYTSKFQRAVRQELMFDSLAVGLDLVTGQYLGAVRTGASSWWDYRNFQWNRDNEMLKLQKGRVNSVVRKSTNFLDTFWKLTRSNNIPDRWLVRSTDLDDLELAMNEQDHHVRLRVLKRMEPFMECYPPYWYYVARTQQSIGDLDGAIQTYERLGNLADGHFRRDEMMTSALANQAVIQAHLGHPDAVQTAQQALSHCTNVWQANLTCSRILQQAGLHEEAEDAILRNLDVQLENDHSTVALLGFYHDTHNTTKLAQYLADERVLAKVPPPVLIRYASRLNDEETPEVVWTALASSMRIEPQVGYGADSILMTCHPVWGIGRSKIGLHVEGGRIIPGELSRRGEYDVVRFAGVGQFGGVLSGPAKLPPLKLEIQYGDKEPILLAFTNQTQEGPRHPGAATVANRNPVDNRGYRLISAQWGERNLAVTQAPRTVQLPMPTPQSPPLNTADLNSAWSPVGQFRRPQALDARPHRAPWGATNSQNPTPPSEPHTDPQENPRPTSQATPAQESPYYRSSRTPEATSSDSSNRATEGNRWRTSSHQPQPEGNRSPPLGVNALTPPCISCEQFRATAVIGQQIRGNTSRFAQQESQGAREAADSLIR